MYSNRTRMVGLSGIDTVSLVDQLMKAESFKYERLKKQSTILQWQQEKYRAVSSSIYGFYSSFLDIASSTSLRMQATFGNLTPTLTGTKIDGTTKTKYTSTAATVKPTATAKEGTYKLAVEQLAAKTSVTSNAAGFAGQLNSTATKNDIANYVNSLAVGDTIKFSLNGVSQEVTITAAMESAIGSASDEADEFASQLETQLQALFNKPITVGFTDPDPSKGRLFINAGLGNDLIIYNGTKADSSKSGTGLNALLSDDANLSTTQYSFSVSYGGNTADINVTFDGTEKWEQVAGMINTKINDYVAAHKAGLSSTATEAEKTKYDFLYNVRVSTDSTDPNDIKFALSSSSADKDITVTDNNMLSAIGITDAMFSLSHTNVLKDSGFSSGDSSFNALRETLGALFGSSFFTGTDPISGEKTATLQLINGKSSITIRENETLQSLINRVNSGVGADGKPNDMGAVLSYDSISGKFTLAAKKEGTANGFSLNPLDTAENRVSLQAVSLFFGVDTSDPDWPMNSAISYDEDASTAIATDAVFWLNGVKFTRDSNRNTIDGLDITLNEVTTSKQYNTTAGSPDNISKITDDELVIIDIKKDNTKTVELVKKFVEAYNELIAQINGEVTATRARSGKYSYYEPLTDDEKGAMSDREIDLWEAKAKQGLLSRDSILSGITRNMRNALGEEVEISDAKFLSLSKIGITTTANYWEGGKLVIDETKLANAIEEYGDDVTKLFTGNIDVSSKLDATQTKSFTNKKLGLGDRLNNIVDAAIGSDGTLTKKAGVEHRARSLLDNSLYKRIKDYENRLSDLLTYLANKEDSYYAMFSRMEAAVTQANNQMTYLQQQLGL